MQSVTAVPVARRSDRTSSVGVTWMVSQSCVTMFSYAVARTIITAVIDVVEMCKL